VVDRLSLVPRLRPGVAIQVIDDDVLALDGADLYRLVGTHAEVFRRIDGARSVRAVADDTLAATAEQVVASVDHLVSQGFLELTDEGPEPRYRRPDSVGVGQDGDVLVLLDLRTGGRHVLSPTAAEVWRLMTATASLRATVAELELDFPDTPGLAEDTAAFVEELESQGLLERA
jgi:hypothetical protein